MSFRRRAPRNETGLRLSYLETLAAQARTTRSRYRRRVPHSEASND